ncbi:hypothetical protein SAMN06297229_0439 [Pseudidiomarina planktonica]|uniref:Z-ring associated protein G n=1 Tax=Pseudidiomarina planktonica TaxID=1323738 RepID=A0A1Y6EDG7_9GAMM|nr:YhcB family protein [Pseudidiomarina planktonica]RUO66083.1 DUF1043 domain-containing protein [Pseudidiomarina planktonica]SMQ60595.1 hypothetical protein SAMN06297229_0439 [Pseudidiomarina planktonica]
MSWIIGVLLVAVGMVIGFFVARYWLQEHSDQARLSDEVTASKQQLASYQREVAEHFATANALVEQLADTQSKLQSYLGHSAELLQQGQYQNDLPFFAEDTLRQLRVANTVKNDSRKQEAGSGDAPPRDYPDSASGLFKGADKKTDAKKKATS